MARTRGDGHAESTAVMRADQLEGLLDVDDEHDSNTMPIEASKLEALLDDERVAPEPPAPRFAPLVPRPTGEDFEDATVVDARAFEDPDAIPLTDADVVEDASESVRTAAIDARQLAKLLDS